MAVAAEREKIKDKEALGAFDAAIDQTVLGVAIKIKENRDSVAVLLGFKSADELNDEVIAKIARDYVEKGEFTANGRPWKKRNIIDAAKGLGNSAAPLLNLFPETAEVLGLDAAKQDPENFLPDSEALAKPASHIAKAVEENSGWMNFIWFAIQGFINWVIDFVSDGKIDNGLMQHIHMVGANAVADSAARRVNDDPEALAVIQQQGGLDKFREQVYNGAYDKLENPKAEKDTSNIVEKLKETDPKKKLDSKSITENHFAESSIEIEQKVQSHVGKMVDEFFDTKKTDVWEKLAKEANNEAKENAKKDSTWYDPRTWEMSQSGYWATPERVQTKMSEAISGGGDSKAASKLISSAVSEGVMAGIKRMTDEDLRNLLNDSSKSGDLTQKISEATFNSADWDKIKKNIDKSTLSEAQKEKLKTVMEAEIKTRIEKMISENSGLIDQAKPFAENLVKFKGNLGKFDSIKDLNTDNNNELTKSELRVLAGDDGKLTRSELDALPDKVKVEFEKILAQDNNKQAPQKLRNGEEVLFDFNLKAASTPTTTAAIQLNL